MIHDFTDKNVFQLLFKPVTYEFSSINGRYDLLAFFTCLQNVLKRSVFYSLHFQTKLCGRITQILNPGPVFHKPTFCDGKVTEVIQ